MAEDVRAAVAGDVYAAHMATRADRASVAPTRDTYHHGDLRAALLATATGMLEDGEAFSLRALARRAGVSPTAPYRHFADRDALESALAAEGFRDLLVDLFAGGAQPTTPDDLVEVGVAYVRFALRCPALFRLMFGTRCDDTNDQRVRSAAALHETLAAALERVIPDADPAPSALACWGLVHGLACLHLDGKLPDSPVAEVDARVRAALGSVLPS